MKQVSVMLVSHFQGSNNPAPQLSLAPFPGPTQLFGAYCKPWKSI